ncbi:hypothetical protein LWI28_023772 [Acer negundo]|uniref:Uncharacterized protein n=1 Tax=Acer negundo TaxID=4023 RepID=A0AAD5IGX7_ACENE|nr:hypothetical protein LWI28_023772 [Acer negundo]
MMKKVSSNVNVSRCRSSQNHQSPPLLLTSRNEAGSDPTKSEKKKSEAEEERICKSRLHQPLLLLLVITLTLTRSEWRRGATASEWRRGVAGSIWVLAWDGSH